MSTSSLHSKSQLIKPVRTDESLIITVLDLIRLIFSLWIFIFAVIACGYAIYAQITLMPNSLPNWNVYIIFFFCLFLLSITEGLHVAAVQLANHSPNEYIGNYPRTARILKYQNKGRNFQHFLIGRQIIVVFCVFVLGRCTTFDSFFSRLPQIFEDITMFTGFFGVVFVVQVAQLTPQILSSNFPSQFMNLWGVHYIYYLCIAIEKTGICYTVWLFCWSIQNTVCFKKLFAEKEIVDDLYMMDSIDSPFSIKSNKTTTIDLTDKFNDIMNLEYNIKHRINKFGENLRNDLNLNSERNKDLKKQGIKDEEKIPLQSDNKLFQRQNNVQNNEILYTFPTKLQCAEQFTKDGLDIPHFLLDESDPKHVPPHLVLLHLLKTDLR